MPSWNIHIAQSEYLLASDTTLSGMVADTNAFIFGSIMPDIPVGYMVPGLQAQEHVDYRITHYANSEPIPKPREYDFWNEWVAPLLANQEQYASSFVSLMLGMWTHLLADCLWNTRVNEYLRAAGNRPNDQFRMRKQADFDGFGRTLSISTVPYETPELSEALARFDRYRLPEHLVHDAVVVAHETVRSNLGIAGHHAPYLLLTEEFFDATLAEALSLTERLVLLRLNGSPAVSAFVAR